jgi:2-C-methyl-D-erythritol 2,4-cyclodiphosphate synthase
MADGHVAEFRSGLGFDAHRAAVGRALFLGGVRFPGEPGLLGHSDGDVVCHALADALLGAAALGDIGEHFPEGDPAVAGIAGMDLLARTVTLVRGRDLSPHSADVTVIAEHPAIAPAREEMRRNVAATLRIGVDWVSVKATRPEGLGLTGDGVGCIALAVLTAG